MGQPVYPSVSYLQSAGRALARWWILREGAQSTTMASQAYLAWWARTYDELESSWLDVYDRSDVYEQLQLYERDAVAVWEADRAGPRPPHFGELSTIADKVGGSAYPLALLVGAAAVLVLIARR